MKDAVRPPAEPLVTAAEIARLAGVTRAAVSNWRRRHDDFPAPVTGSTSSPLFALPEIRAWLDKQRKGQQVSNEVRLWQQLRSVHGDNMIRGLTTVAELLAGSAHESGTDRDPALQALVDELTVELTPAELLTNLTARYVESSGRAGSEQITPPRLIRAILDFAGGHGGTVFDPACGIGSLLFAFRAQADVLTGQDIDPVSARYAQLRADLLGLPNVTINPGDALREDQQRELKADLVVCEPPVGVADWGREDLLLDPRWELGVPSRAESELAWLQHCYFHTAPGGRVLMVMPASVAYRKAGRRIRAELVRRGLLTQVVALPPGMAASHALPVHLWLLRRPAGPDDAADFVRMTDLTANDPDGSLEPVEGQTADVPRIDLLDDTVDLTPATHISVMHTDFAAEYAATLASIELQLTSLLTKLPTLTAGSGSGFLDGATVSVSDLARAGLVEALGNEAVSTSEQLDTDYLNGFLRSASNTRRSTSTSGTFRTDTRGSRIPQMAIEEQRRYGAAFRALAEFEQRVKKLAELSEQAAVLARDGLTNGALAPPSSDE
ncbi:SAM-dependent methyltransferase [Streptomyces sp. A3M-1-3]|uniref:N-6 DNA methylase n=1 Tax=Streptomyces sp. A3M-1-3 TaxID=2962044 RepID=UPI0020B7F5BF|nr:N-6 DNA methylase [Streptomyces sp. A3M-1-3]MCP3818399.1 SAM-dependent methyltransferase [Streptomyces sp. A3M-1-3]